MMLVEKIQRRIAEAVERYIADMKPDEKHPLLSRRARGFRLHRLLVVAAEAIAAFTPTMSIPKAGSVPAIMWRCRQRSRMPRPAGLDQVRRTGLDVTLKDPIRRAIQPRPGRLVLFPSYMWHGTVPFRDTQPRTTIAFDVVPKI